MTAVGAELGVPVRHVTRAVQYCGAFYGQTSIGGVSEASGGWGVLLYIKPGDERSDSPGWKHPHGSIRL